MNDFQHVEGWGFQPW